MKDRMTISFEEEQKPFWDKLKKEEFYNRSQSEMVRHIIALGIKAKGKETRKST